LPLQETEQLASDRALQAAAELAFALASAVPRATYRLVGSWQRSWSITMVSRLDRLATCGQPLHDAELVALSRLDVEPLGVHL
jgi:hypothetical protein